MKQIISPVILSHKLWAISSIWSVWYGPIPYSEILNFSIFALSMLTSILNHSEAPWICCVWESYSIFCFLSSSSSGTRIDLEICIDFKFKFSLKFFDWRGFASEVFQIVGLPWRVCQGVRCGYLQHRGQEFSIRLMYHWMRWNFRWELIFEFDILSQVA